MNSNLGLKYHPNNPGRKAIVLRFLSAVYKVAAVFVLLLNANDLLAQVTTISSWASQYHGTGNCSVSYTVPAGTGAYRILVVGVASSQAAVGARTVTITYGGQTLTLAAGDMSTTTIRQHTALYYLNEAGIDAASGTTLAVSFSGGTTRVNDVWASVYDYVNQSSPLTNTRNYNNTTAVSTYAFATALTVNANDQAVEVISSLRSGNTTPRTITPATNWTMSNEQTWNTTDGVRNGVYNRSIPASNTTDVSSTSLSGTALGSMTGISLAGTPKLTLSNPTTAVGAANVCASSSTVPIHAFKITGTSGGGTLTNFTFTTTGTYAAAEIVNFKIWYNSSNSLGSATLLATNSSPGAAGAQTFTAFSHAIGNTTEFFWITMDVASSVTDGHTLTVSASASGDMTTTVAKAGSANASGQQTLCANLTAVSIAPTGSQSICDNSSGTLLTASETGGGTITHQWGKRSISGGPITNITGATGSTYTPTGADLGLGTWYVVCTSSPSCGSAMVSNEVIVTVNAAPVAPTLSNTENSGTTPDDAKICNGASIILSSSAATSYSWNPGGATTQVINVSPSSTTTYTVTITDASGCSNSSSISVTVYSNPAASAASNVPICTGSPLNLIGGPGSMTTYAWSGPNSFSSSIQSPNVSSSYDNATMAGTYTITVTDGNACSAEASVVVSRSGLYKSNISSGNWTSAASWLISNDDGVTWGSASTYPTNGNSCSVEILNGHTITVDGSIAAPNTVTDQGGTIDIPASRRLTIITGFTFTNNGTLTVRGGGSQTGASAVWDTYGLVIDGGTFINNLSDTNKVYVDPYGVIALSVTVSGSVLTNNGIIENNGGYYNWTGTCPGPGGSTQKKYDGILNYCSYAANSCSRSSTVNNYGTINNNSIINCAGGYYRGGQTIFYDLNNYGDYNNNNNRSNTDFSHQFINYASGTVTNGGNFTMSGSGVSGINYGTFFDNWSTNVDDGASYTNASSGIINLLNDGAVRGSTTNSTGTSITNDGTINNYNGYTPGYLNGIVLNNRSSSRTVTFTNGATGIINNNGPWYNVGSFTNNGSITNDGTKADIHNYYYASGVVGSITNNNLFIHNAALDNGQNCSFTNATGSEFRYQATTGSITSYLSTNYLKYQGTALLNYNGTGAQTTSLQEWPTAANIPTYIKIDNSSGAANGVTLNSARTIANLLTLTNGALKLNTNTLTINNSSTSAIARDGVTQNGYIVSEQNLAVNASKITWNCGTTTGSFVFPFGANDGSYLPLTINKTSGTSANVTTSTRTTGTDNTPWAGVSDVAAVANMNCTGGGDGSVSSVIDRWWDITPTAALTADVTFSYRGAENTTSSPSSELVVQHWVGTYWNDGKGGASSTYSATGTMGQTSGVGSVTVSGLNEFSPYVLALKENFLPVELLNFNASCGDDNILISWVTASETNNDYFSVERSINTIEWEPIAKVNGSGTTNSYTSYTATDNEPYFNRTSYYRLKQVDYDGQSNYSDVASANCSVPENNIDLNIADSDDGINIFISNGKSDYHISVYDISGKLLCNKIIINTSSQQTQQLILGKELFSPGLYILYVHAGDQSVMRKFFIK